MTSAFNTRLEQFDLSESDTSTLAALASVVQTFAPSRIIFGEQDSEKIILLVDGWSVQCKYLPDGRRQVVSMCLPGEIFNLEGLFVSQRYEQLCALTPCMVSIFPIEKVRRLIENNSAVLRVLLNQMVVRAGTSAEWILSLGRRSTRERLAHLLCELHVRLEATGSAKAGAYYFPLTQTDLGDAMGVSSVHINRTIQSFRSEGLVSFPSRRFIQIDFIALAKMADFDPAYLGSQRTETNISRGWL